MKKWIVADLDGTLVHQNQISKEDKDTVSTLQKNGYIFTIATGRHYTSAIKIVKELEIAFPVICNNGALVIDPVSNRIYSEHLLSSSTVKEIMNQCNLIGIHYLLYTKKRVIGTAQAKAKLLEHIGDVPIDEVANPFMDEHLDEGILKILMIENDTDKRTQIQQKLKSFKDISHVASNTNFIDVGSKQSSKGNALAFLAKHLVLPLSSCIAIGDQENDTSMLVRAGIGIAMGNAVDSLKDIADYVTAPYSEHGFSQAIDAFVIKTRQ